MDIVSARFGTAADFEKETGVSCDFQQLRMHGKTVTTVGGFMLLLLSPPNDAGGRGSIDIIIKENFELALMQYERLAEAVPAGKLPRTFENGKLVTVDATDWTSGFFPGALWYVYEYTRSPKWRRLALEFTRRTDAACGLTGTHDVGFMLYCGHGNALRLDGGKAHRDILLKGAGNLCRRFNPAAGCIRSWDFGETRWQFPVIIDNMMNLELLMWAFRETGVQWYRDVAVSHAHRTLANHFRQDGSCYHVVDYDPESGLPILKETYQGYANESAWARGQAWALYGYTMMYRETRNQVYLDQAHRIARFILTHPRLPGDKIPLWDFDVPDADSAPRDSSAAAIMASALIELSGYSASALAAHYIRIARAQLHALSSEKYRAAVGENGGFILKQATGFRHRDSEVNAPLNYGDYYFLEALLRLRHVEESKKQHEIIEKPK
ncbi:MAG: glycoside hydrolase family 88 protein [Opitutaceae bacterium]|nr:glycoside hydrolase family 88 protein [Opitutaceae bacterium]